MKINMKNKWCPVHNGWCLGCGNKQPCKSDCPAGSRYSTNKKECSCKS